MIHCTIGTQDYPVLRDLLVSEQLGNKSTATLRLDCTGITPPEAGDIVELYNDDERIFWGVCGIPTSPKYKTGLERQIYKVQCTNANALMSNRIINLAVKRQTVTQIVNTLFTDYIADEGVTIGHISEIDAKFTTYVAANLNLQSALNELADYADATWFIDNNKQFWFVSQPDAPQFAHTVNAAFLFGTELQSKKTAYDIRTVQIVTGANAETLPQTEEFLYDGVSNAFTLSFPVSVQPTIYVNGVEVPREQVGATGLSNDDENVAFQFSFNSHTIRYVKDSGYMTSGATVTVEYIGLFPLRISVSNDEKIAEIAAKTGTSGRREVVYIASGKTTMSDAQELANSLLQQFEVGTETVTFWALRSQLAALGVQPDDLGIMTRVSIDLPELHITDDYTVTARETSVFDGSGDVLDLKYKWTLKNNNFLRSDAETISRLYRDVSALSVRENDTIVNDSAIFERMSLAESLTFDRAIVFYPTTTAAPAGIFAPLALSADVYPGV